MWEVKDQQRKLKWLLKVRESIKGVNAEIHAEIKCGYPYSSLCTKQQSALPPSKRLKFKTPESFEQHMHYNIYVFIFWYYIN